MVNTLKSLEVAGKIQTQIQTQGREEICRKYGVKWKSDGKHSEAKAGGSQWE